MHACTRKVIYTYLAILSLIVTSNPGYSYYFRKNIFENTLLFTNFSKISRYMVLYKDFSYKQVTLEVTF